MGEQKLTTGYVYSEISLAGRAVCDEHPFACSENPIDRKRNEKEESRKRPDASNENDDTSNVYSCLFRDFGSISASVSPWLNRRADHN
jgi:hypothetical protein